ncbi:MAG: hypothetical protein JO024_03000 [Candidatus Eremiobacteraeota bacterium]|nr:hypothetical protein [Candidatus Eremiobacteraeota bacterium]
MQCIPAKRLCNLVALIAALVASVAPQPSSAAISKGDELLVKIRQVFRSHRPPPPYVAYSLVRQQQTEEGFPDFIWSYTYHIWCRTLDRAALGRKVYRGDARGPLEFLRPEFNEARDPGPPTADLFERAPVRPQPVEFVPTPEPSGMPATIGSVTAIGELEYHVTAVNTEGELLHLSLRPIRDPDRNRLREVYVDKLTYELTKVIATDKMFIEPGYEVHPQLYTITMGMLDGRPVVTAIHGVTTDDYYGDGREVDYTFKDIKFPSSLPDWYFDARSYAMHSEQAPL